MAALGYPSHRTFVAHLHDALSDQDNRVFGIEVVDSDQKKIKVFFAGPQNTAYETGTYEMNIQFPSNYPQRTPDVVFKTPIWNAHVNPKDMKLIFDNLPGYTIADTLAYVGVILRNDQQDVDSHYVRTAKYWNVEYAGGDQYPAHKLMNEHVWELIEMGFTALDATIALSSTDWNKQMALEELLNKGEN